MASPFWLSWISNLLFWGSICFPSQKGCNIAHGYYLNEDEFSSRVGGLDPQTSNQFHSFSLKPNHDTASLRDEMQAMRNQRYVFRQREPFHHENYKDAGVSTGLGEELTNRKPELDQDVPSSPPVPKHAHDGPDQQHPLGILVSEHRQAKNMAGPSFSSIKDFKRFVELMKRAFLMPGDDLESHFQTARETIKKEIASNAVNMKRQHDTGHRSSSANEGTAHDDTSGNEDRRAATSTALEHGANYQMPSESVSVRDAIDPADSLAPTSVYDKRGRGPGSAVYPRDHSAATGHVSRRYDGVDHGLISRGNPDIVTSAPHVRNKAPPSISYKLPGQIPNGSLIGHDSLLSGHLTAPSVHSQNRPSQNFSHYSSRTSEKNIRQEPKSTSPTEDSTKETQKPSRGLELARDVPSRVTSDQILSAPMRTPLSSYRRVPRVMPRRGQLYVPDSQPEHDRRPAISSQGYQHTVGTLSNYINHMPTAHLPRSTGSVSSSSNNPSQSSTLFGVQTSRPHDAQNLSLKRKPVRFYTRYTVQPPSSYGSSRPDGHLKDKSASVGHPLNPTAQSKDEKLKRHLVAAIS
nr:uncharacterized protein LOC120809859 [Gasterosteus aculeatus aculeatus]XP_040019932.1 uncharacterized protein LOC120809859 [Gasterosteus aculeatus aculeatus]